MKKDDLWLDSCAYTHAAQDPPRADSQKELAQDIVALRAIKELFRAREIELGISLNVISEINGNDDYEKAQRFWADVEPVTYPQEIGLAGCRIPSGDGNYESLVAGWEQKLAPIAKKVGDYPGKDTALLINCAYFGGIFITTDYKFLNKLRSEGRDINFLRASRPSDYILKHMKKNE